MDEADKCMLWVVMDDPKKEMTTCRKERVQLAQWCVSSCAQVFSTCTLTNFSSCFPARLSFAFYLTVETMVEFISMNSYHKLPASWRKH